MQISVFSFEFQQNRIKKHNKTQSKMAAMESE